jgi:ribonuclease HI
MHPNNAPSTLPTNTTLIHPLNKHLISTILLTDASVTNTLLSLSKLLSDLTNLEFWTDGSFKQHTPFISEMGFGWILNLTIRQDIEFCGSIKHFVSSTKAECFALLTCLIISPPNSTVSIFTDSLSMIHTYNLIFHSNLSTRKFLKINNYFIWDAIKTIIKKLNLTLTLTKVKAHSNLPLNDKADELAAKGRLSSHYIKINHKALSIPITFNGTH